jgi:hypothetical protein
MGEPVFLTSCQKEIFMPEYLITVDIWIEASSNAKAEIEAKRIYGGIDDVVAEQNDPAKTIINLELRTPSRALLRSITSEKARSK